jgi:7-carboxy-7-deazaguanine synthase
MLNLTEIFYSLQGESSYAGIPCIFIRLAGCNLRCKYCDTTYSYNTSYTLEIPEILQEVQKYEPVKLVELTGGEPLLQQEIYTLMVDLQKAEYTVLLETNGSVSLAKVPEYVIKIVDVKCPSSGFPDSFVLSNIDFLTCKDELKFVISDERDYKWAKKFLQANNLKHHNILFSCVADSMNPNELAELILKDKLNVKLQIQLHKILDLK